MDFKNVNLTHKGNDLIDQTQVQKSITYNPTDQKLELVGDNATPGNNKAYGTDGSGTKGFYDFATSTQLSTELSQRTSADIVLSTNLSTETSIRLSADSVLSAGLSTEVSTRTAQSTTTSTAISTRVSVDTAISNSLSTEISTRTSQSTTTSTSLSTEISNRISGDTVLTNNLSTEVSLRTSQSTTISTSLSNLTSTDTVLTNNLSAEVSNRISGDTILTNNLSTEVSNRISSNTSEASIRLFADTLASTNLSIEISQRISADIALGGSITLQKAYDNSNVAGDGSLIKLSTGKPFEILDNNDSTYFKIDPDGTNPTKVTITGPTNIAGDVAITGNLTISGSNTTVNSLITDTDHILLSPASASTTALQIKPDTGVILTSPIVDLYIAQADSSVFNISKDGNTTVNGNFTISGTHTVDVGSNKIINVTNGSNPQDAVAFNQLSAEISNRTSADVSASTNLSSEVSLRTSQSTTTSTALSTEISSRISADTLEASIRLSADTILSTNLSTEISNRILGDNNNSTAISTEISNRISGDTLISTSLSTEISTRTSQSTTTSTALSTEISNRISGDTLEASIRLSADTVLSTNLSSEVSLRTGQSTTTSTALSTEISNRLSGDTVLTNNLSTEISTRTSQSTTTSTSLSTEISNRISGDTLEASIRLSADTILTNNLSTEVSNRISGDLVLTNNLSTEISIRTSTDTALSVAINGKEPIITPGTITQYWRGDKTWQTLVTGSSITGCRPVYTTPVADTTIGYTTSGSSTDGNNQNQIWVSSYALASTLTLESLSINFSAIGGVCRMGVYSNVGGVPTTKLAETAEFTPVVGWNTIPVVTEVSLAAGTYWLAFLGNNNGLTVRCETTGGTQKQATFTYAALPTTYPAYTTTTIKPSIYASFYNPADNILNISSGAIDVMGTGVINSSPYTLDWTHLESGMVRQANVWYYVYVDVISNTFHAFLSTTVPTRDYFGNTISPSANQPRYHPTLTARYVGQVKTDVDKNIIPFIIMDGHYSYVGQGYNYLITSGIATTKTPINCRTLVPYTSSIATVYIDDESSTGNKYVGDANSWMFFCTHILGGTIVNIPITNDSVYYQTPGSGSGISIGIHGFYESV